VVMIQVALHLFVSNFLNKKNIFFYLVPGAGNFPPAATGFPNTGTPITLGANLPHVDPNNFQGIVHWGPERVVSGLPPGQLPLGGGGAVSGGTGIN